MKTQHTPGPWVVRNGTEVFCGRKRVCHVNAASKEPLNMMQDHQVAEANARLIAAAPDLLEALKQIYSIVVIHSAATNNNFAWAELDQVNAAIAKGEQA